MDSLVFSDLPIEIRQTIMTMIEDPMTLRAASCVNQSYNSLLKPKIRLILSKNELNILVAGSEKSGKSTLIRRLLLEHGVLTQKEFDDEVDFSRNNTARIGDKRCNFYETSLHLTNMTPKMKVDVVIVMFSARDMPTSMHHISSAIRVAKFLGFYPILIVASQMADRSGQDAEMFENVRNYSPVLDKKSNGAFLVPVDSLNGSNIVRNEEADFAPWYQGPPLSQILAHIEGAPDRLKCLPRFLPVESQIDEISGYLVAGTLKVGDVLSDGSENEAEILQIVSKDGSTNNLVNPGEYKLKLGGDHIRFSAFKLLGPGLVPTKRFLAKITIVEHPGSIRVGYAPSFDLTRHPDQRKIPCKFTKFISLLYERNLDEIVEDNPVELKTGQTALVEIAPTKSFCLESIKTYPELARFTFEDMRIVVGVGFIIDVFPN